VDQPSRLPLNAPEHTSQPEKSNVSFETGVPSKLSNNKWSKLSVDLYNLVNSTTSGRSALNANLKSFSDTYDLIASEAAANFPWPGASNIRLPYSASQLENLVARVLGEVTSHGRLFLINGNTPQACDVAGIVEAFYNTEARRRRADGKTYFDKYEELLQAGLRDGTGVLEQMWARERVRREVQSPVPAMNPATGEPILDESGQPVINYETQDMDIYRKDYAQYTVVPLKEFYLAPNEARSIEDARAVMRVEWLYESDLDARCRKGFFDSKECEQALNYVQTGQTDAARDPQGSYDKTASYQIDIGPGVGPMMSEFYKERGPLKVWRIHSNLFDMNGDGIPEENVFWLSWSNQRMLGFMPYNYASGIRPFFLFTPFPRIAEAYGYSIIERLAGVQQSLDANNKARNDQLSLMMAPAMKIKAGSKVLNAKGAGAYRPNASYEVENTSSTDGDMVQFQIGVVPTASYQEESLFKQYGNEYTGQDQASMGAQTSGRRSATEMKQRQASGGIRTSLIATHFRGVMDQIVNFNHQLNRQYMNTPESVLMQGGGQAQVFTVSPEMLMQDLTIQVAGASDPIDSTTRNNEMMALFQLVMNVPYIQQNPKLSYEWIKTLVEQRGLRNVQQLIGTPDDAIQFMQQQMQAQQAQMAAGKGQPPQKK
jgi:hypothetical protein